MKPEKININPPTGAEKIEVVFRETNSVNELEVKAPLKIALIGVPGSIATFLAKRVSLLDQKECHVVVNREKLSMMLVINESDFYNSGSVTDKLEYHHKLKEFGINLGKTWEPNLLGQFFKLNRVYFEDRTENMTVVAALKDFKAKVGVSIEKMKNESGSFADNYSGAVTSNLPGSFKLNIPVFKGMPKESLEVEFFAHVNGRDVELELMSPGAVQTLEEVRDSVFDMQITSIREIAPDIPIIEQ